MESSEGEESGDDQTPREAKKYCASFSDKGCEELLISIPMPMLAQLMHAGDVNSTI